MSDSAASGPDQDLDLAEPDPTGSDRTWTSDLALYLAVAFGVAWLLSLPVWLSGAGLSSPALGICASVMMGAPSLGAAAVALAARRRRGTRGPAGGLRASTGLGLGPDRARTGRLIALAWLGIPLLVLVSGLASAAAGTLDVDLAHLGSLQDSLPASAVRIPGGVHTALALVAGQSVTLGIAITTVFALGEEWGWRGWLQPHLTRRWGLPRALLATGVIWGLWHAPLTLLGYNYPQLGPWAALYFVPFTVLASVLLGWLRHVSGSVWPAAVGHAAINSTAGIVLLVAPAHAEADPVVAGLTGCVGWVVLAAAAVLLIRTVRPAATGPAPR